MTILYMLIGLPGSGKSTYRKALKTFLEKTQQIQPSVISSDDYIERYACEDNITYNKAFLLYAKQATEEINKDLEYDIKNYFPIIWDQTNLTAKSRKQKLSKIPSYYHKIAIAFDVDMEIIFARNNLRKSTNRSIPLNILNEMITSYELPVIDEGFNSVIINDDLELSMLKTYLNTLKRKE